ncbi:MAG: TIGR02117 family protein [Leptolyngbyaceae cyanobacterium HOT.MB2.61]|jgi:uncharacterized protein (TIGR02117 family)|nr:TIGR02117 family protein [Leptolyngbyaceae cyanobacterium HOT.MB2.61]
MRRTVVLRRIGVYVSGSILTIVALLAIAALTPRKWGNLRRSEDCDLKIYVSGGLMHTNLIVPVQTVVFDWEKYLDLEEIGNRPADDYRYLQFGWGDRIFYMETPSWAEMSIPSALRALFLQNPSAMFVKGHSTIPRYPGEELKCISLGHDDYLAMMQFIESSFQADSQGRKLRLGSGQDGESGFYAAKDKYSMFKTCNSWTADALRAANVNTPLWGGLAPAVMFHLRNGCSCQEEGW